MTPLLSHPQLVRNPPASRGRHVVHHPVQERLRLSPQQRRPGSTENRLGTLVGSSQGDGRVEGKIGSPCTNAPCDVGERPGVDDGATGKERFAGLSLPGARGDVQEENVDAVGGEEGSVLRLGVASSASVGGCHGTV